jgi:exopolysaccharide biosynthesis polyprenyl glycosylphosphotransferase
MLNVFVARNIWKTAFLPILDLANLMGAALIAYILRYQIFVENFDSVKLISGNQYIFLSFIINLFIVFIFACLGIYSISQKPRFYQVIINIFIGILSVILAVISILYFNEYSENGILQTVRISRFVVAIYGILSFSAVLLGRLIFLAIEDLLYRSGIGIYSTIVIGKNDSKVKTLITQLKKQHFIKNIFYFENLNNNLFENKLLPLIQDGNCGEIYLFSDSKNHEIESKLSQIAERKKIRFLFTPEGYNNFELYQVNSVKIKNIYFFEMLYTPLDGWLVVLKRFFDLFISITFIILFSWLYLLISLAIKLDSKGSILYYSERIGSNGKIFKMYKFRRFKQEYCTSELDPNAKEALEFEKKLIQEQGQSADRGALYKIKNDPRMTRVGAFLEKTSLDELPQFFNVLIGNLSLVGPRAHQPREVNKYQDHHFKVLNIKPGITGLAQIKGRSDLHFEDEVKYDTFYVHNWTFWLDLWILILTPIVIFFKSHKS